MSSGETGTVFVVGSWLAEGEQHRSAYRAHLDTDGSLSMQQIGKLEGASEGDYIPVAVSDDGLTVAGNYSSGIKQRAFVWRAKTDDLSDGMTQDLANLQVSVPKLAADTAVAVSQQKGLIDSLARSTFVAAKGQSGIRVSGNVEHSKKPGVADIGSQNSQIGTLTFGHGVSDTVTLGGSVSMLSSSLGNTAFDTRNGYGLSLWARMSEDGVARTGWQGETAIGHGKQNVTVTRGAGLDNVEQVKGDTDLSTTALYAKLGYGSMTQEGWLVTPSVGVAHSRSKRGGYTETSGLFNASYDALTIARTTLSLGVSGEKQISANGWLTLVSGVDHDIDIDDARFVAKTDIMGIESYNTDLAQAYNDTRFSLQAGYRHELTQASEISFNVRAGEADFGNGLKTNVGVAYQIRF